MFDTIITALASMWDALISTIQTFWDWFKQGWVWVITTIIAVVSITNTVVEFVWTQVQNLVTAAGYLSVPGGEAVTVGSGVANEWLQTANTFFPVAEIFTLISAMSIVWMGGITYRLVKSWLPTLS